MKKMKKRPITLLEIMIVIFLIGLIGGVVGYNMKGSLDEGRAFKTEQASLRVREILLLEVANGAELDQVVGDSFSCLKNSGLCENPDKLLKDGWNQPFVIKKKGNHDISVVSQKLKDYRAKKNKGRGVQEQVDDDAED